MFPECRADSCLRLPVAEADRSCKGYYYYWSVMWMSSNMVAIFCMLKLMICSMPDKFCSSWLEMPFGVERAEDLGVKASEAEIRIVGNECSI